FGLTPIPGRKVKAPAVKECALHMECRLKEAITTGDHTLFVGEVLAAYGDENAFDGEFINTEVLRPIFQVGGDIFTTIGELRKKCG
ncbi:MAG: flavin reductase, partial [Candidatus Hadarchaeales archaeon]